jgi:hypothetical protein
MNNLQILCHFFKSKSQTIHIYQKQQTATDVFCFYISYLEIKIKRNLKENKNEL